MASSSRRPIRLRISGTVQSLPEHGISSTHSRWGNSFAPGGAWYCGAWHHTRRLFYGKSPTRKWDCRRFQAEYEKETGARHHRKLKDKIQMPSRVVVYSHGPFIRGKGCDGCGSQCVVMEEVAFMNIKPCCSTPAFNRCSRNCWINTI